LEDLMPNGYTFSYPKVKQFQDENDKTLYECRVNVMDLRTGRIVAECSAVDVDRVDAQRRTVDQADAFMNKDRGTVQTE
jgi:hypothetical protein